MLDRFEYKVPNLKEKYVIDFIIAPFCIQLIDLINHIFLGWEQSIREGGGDHYIEFYPYYLFPGSKKPITVIMAIYYIRKANE